MESSVKSGITLEGLQRQLQDVAAQCHKYSQAVSADSVLWSAVAERLESIEAYLRLLPSVPSLQELVTMREKINANTAACNALRESVIIMQEHYDRLREEYESLHRSLRFR